MNTNPKVDWFFDKATEWKEEYRALRKIVLASGLIEELKWGQPCYTFEGKNVAIIHGFKEYCGLLFVKGALLNDPDNLLIQQTKNVQAARQMRFTSAKQITTIQRTLRAYIKQAIELEKAGQKVPLKKTSEYEMPEELEQAFKKSPAFKRAFYQLTPGRQRGYLLHFAQPKLSKTREARIEKYTQQILNGKGLND